MFFTIKVRAYTNLKSSPFLLNTLIEKIIIGFLSNKHTGTEDDIKDRYCHIINSRPSYAFTLFHKTSFKAFN